MKHLRKFENFLVDNDAEENLKDKEEELEEDEVQDEEEIEEVTPEGDDN